MISIPINVSANQIGIPVKIDSSYSVLPSKPYQGAVTVIPSEEQQILATKNLIVAENIVIEPIPSNYGLITWDGVTLTVS